MKKKFGLFFIAIGILNSACYAETVKIDATSFKTTVQVQDEDVYLLENLLKRRDQLVQDIATLNAALIDLDALIASGRNLGIKTQEEIDAEINP